ncbi:MAG: DUF4912 domain-containing protein, partial [Candidatus Omnitrophica bacterium]|nr:DUF4912 domain-containing protein [Candidatus Omnitrophota bacterium]
MALPRNKNKKSFLKVIFNLLKKIYEFFFVKEFGVKKAKPIALDKTHRHSEPQHIFRKEYAPSPRQGAPIGYKPSAQELPDNYNEDKIILQVRDPWWLHSYWEVTQSTKDRLKYSFGEKYHQADWILRVYDVSFIIFNGNNAHRYFDIGVGYDSNNWYINVSSGSSFCVELGLRLKDGTFITIVRSNTVTTPSDGPSSILDEEWMILD